MSSDTVTISVNRKIPSSKISSTFRIDKDGFQSIYKIPLSNLSKLYKKDSPKDEKIRRLIINKEPPRFSIEKSEEIRCSQLLALNGFVYNLPILIAFQFFSLILGYHKCSNCSIPLFVKLKM